MRPAHRGSLWIELTATGLLVFVWPSAAWANPIVPFVVIIWPAAWLLLIPIAILEASIAVRVVGLPFGAGMSLSFRANLLSTLVGVPLATCLNPVPMWLIELKPSGIASVALPLIFFASLMLPLYLVSVVTEAFVARRFLDKDHRRYAWRWAWLANLASYAVIPAGLAILVLIVWLTE